MTAFLQRVNQAAFLKGQVSVAAEQHEIQEKSQKLKRHRCR